jgi:VIT1/CCC1 family predicted Fe2+/Mn2+ transporter
MRHSIEVGFSFGLTSGIITTLGLMVGLNSGTNSKLVVLGGILTIAIADSFSDALGIHVSEESENIHSKREIWESTLSTFLFKFIIASSFIVPVIILPLSTAILVSIIWGFILLIIMSIRIALIQQIKPRNVVFEHITITIIVIILAQFIGEMISKIFT